MKNKIEQIILKAIREELSEYSEPSKPKAEYVLLELKERIPEIAQEILDSVVEAIEKDMKAKMKNWHGTGVLMVEDYFNLTK